MGFSDLSNRKKLGFISLVLLWIFIVIILITVRTILVPFIASVFIAYLIEPIIKYINSLKIKNIPIPRWNAVILVYICFFLIVYLFSLYAIPQLSKETMRFAEEGKVILNKLDANVINELSEKVDMFVKNRGLDTFLTGSDSIDIKQSIEQTFRHALTTVRNNFLHFVGFSRTILSKILGFIFTFFLILMVTGFISSDTERINKFIFKLVPITNRDDYDAIMKRIDTGLSGVVRGQVLICLVNGVLTLIGLLILGVKFAFLLGILAMLFSIIPIYGSILSSIPIVAIALMQGFWSGLLTLFWIIGIHLLEGNFLNPKIMGQTSRIHPVIIIMALVAGEQFYGIIGALFAVPVASIIISFFNFFHKKALKFQSE